MRKGLFTGPPPALLIAGTLLSVICYNYWSYCCGRCTLGTFVTLGPFGLLLLGLTLVGALVLLVLRHRRRPGRPGCTCGSALASDWKFCPTCGAPRLG
ncbi:hypothetical protein DSOUD_1292 [Desulfuromonas soudanensis]|uniref:Zinc-ribbon domain-containing protein n=1 Tax=Desulfuromonas soudanensis TaxID=1603606 RepID=A0A0M3QFH4_9BACT|nr:hypothetical protein [Desulfuromonas soudanensis]ALC16073.1 hypothetical protein DSOUD_1292 [Desulfuromonas soudanensis]